MTAFTTPQVARGFAWLVAGYAGRSLAYLGITVLLARALGPEGYGKVVLFIALTGAIALVAGSWPFLSVPVLCAHGSPLGSVVTSALALAIGAAAILSAAVLPFSESISGSGSSVIPAVALYASALIGLQAVYAMFQVREQMRAIAMIQALERVLTFVLLGGLVLAGALSLEAAQLGLGTGAMVILIGATIMARARLGLRAERMTPSAAMVRQVLGVAGPMAVVSVCSYLVAYVDVLLLKWFVGDREVGLYALGYQIFTLVIQVGALWIVAALPAHAVEHARGTSETVVSPLVLRRVAYAWTAAMLLLAAGAALGLGTVFGARYEAARGPLVLLIAGTPLLAGYFVTVPLLVAAGRAKRLAAVSLAGLLINVGLDLALMPEHGFWAPAIATGAQNAVVATALLVATFGGGTAVRLLAGAVPAVCLCVALASAPDALLLTALAMVVGAGYAVAATPKPRRPTSCA